jgi:hypothetical protein
MTSLSEVQDRLDEWNGFPIRCQHTGTTLSSVLPWEATTSLYRKIPARRLYDRRAVMASDASDFAVASYSVEGLPEFSFSDELTAEERGESSSHRELLAISRTLDFMKRSGSLRPSEWTTLWWLTDNQNVEKMIAKGLGKIKIMYLVLEILKRARSLKYQVEPVWVSRDRTIHFSRRPTPSVTEWTRIIGPFQMKTRPTCPACTGRSR